MIHTLFVNADTQLESLQKEMRKRLMTGGAVVRLAEGMSEAELTQLMERFLPEARPFNLATQVLVEIARRSSPSTTLRFRLEGIHLPEIERALVGDTQDSE